MELFGKVHDAATLAIPSDGSVKGRTVVVVVAPVVLFGNYLQAEREYERSGRPDHLYILSDASSPVRITRTGPSRLSIRPEQGFLYTPLERHYRQAPLPTGTEVTLSALRARVTESRAEGRPGTVEFAFERPPGEYLFVIWRDGRYVPFELPAEGESVTAPEEDFGEILLRGALSGTPIAAQPRARLE